MHQGLASFRLSLVHYPCDTNKVINNRCTESLFIVTGTTGAILLCAFFVDLIVWYKAGSISFVEEPGGGSAGNEEELSPMTAATKPHSETSV